MTTLTSTGLIGLEQIQRQAWRILIENLNDYITQVETFMAISDEEVAELSGQDYEPTDIERVELENFYEGHRPSLINAPIERYPNVAVMAYRGVPGDENTVLDQIDSYNDTLALELMVKGQDEQTVNRRVQRTAEAANLCLMRDQSLGGLVTGFETAPTLTVSDVFTRKERTSYGPHWYWQGARIEYAVRKDAVAPTAPTGSILRAALSPGNGNGNSQADYSQFIDQG